MEHILYLLAKKQDLPSVTAEDDYPVTSGWRRTYETELANCVEITVTTSINLERYFDQNDEYCRTSMKRALSQMGTIELSITEAKRTDVKRMYLINNCHSSDDINRIARELRTICLKSSNAKYNASSILIESEYVDKIGVDPEEETEGVKMLTLSVQPGEDETMKCLEKYQQETVLTLERTHSRLTLLEATLSESQECIDRSNQVEVDLYNKNIDTQREKQTRLKETIIVGLPSSVTLDDEIKRGEKHIHWESSLWTQKKPAGTKMETIAHFAS